VDSGQWTVDRSGIGRRCCGWFHDLSFGFSPITQKSSSQPSALSSRFNCAPRGDNYAQMTEIKFQRSEIERATMADATRVTGANRNTLKVHLRSLVEQRHLARHGTGKGPWYGVG